MKEFNEETHVVVEKDTLNELSTNLVVLGLLETKQPEPDAIIKAALKMSEEVPLDVLDGNNAIEYEETKESEEQMMATLLQERLMARGFEHSYLSKLNLSELFLVFRTSDYHDVMLQTLSDRGIPKSKINRKKTKAIHDLFINL